MTLFRCKNCFNIQIAEVVDPKYLWSDYTYFSGQTKSIKEHFDNFLRNLYTTYPTPDPNISVIEYLNQLKEGRPQFHMKWAYIYDFMHSINEYFVRKGETL